MIRIKPVSTYLPELIQQHLSENKCGCNDSGVQSFDRKPAGLPSIIGNDRVSIPRSIWVDPLLDAVDVRSWGVIKSQAESGSAGLISLNQLLKEQLQYSKATISKVIYVLRLTRWISLCPADLGTKGKRYVVHDSPCAINEAINLDAHYLAFVKKQLTHSNKQIRSIADTVWKNSQGMLSDEGQALNQLSSLSVSHFIDQLNRNVSPIRYVMPDKAPSVNGVQKMNLKSDQPIKDTKPVSTRCEGEQKQLLDGQVQLVNQEEI